MNKKQTPKDYMNLAYSKANKQTSHPIYPQTDDIAQELLKYLYTRPINNVAGVLYYGSLNVWNKITKLEFNKNDSSCEFKPPHKSNSNYKTIDDKIFLKEFMEWLPTDKDRYVWDQHLNYDRTMSMIGKEIGKSRAVMSYYKIKKLEEFREYIGKK